MTNLDHSFYMHIYIYMHAHILRLYMHTHTHARDIEMLMKRTPNHGTEKQVEISGIEIVNGQKAFVMRFLQLGWADDVSGFEL